MAHFWITIDGKKYFDDIAYEEALLQNTGYPWPSLWKLVPGFDGRYICSNLGRMISLARYNGIPKILKPDCNVFRSRNEYVSVCIRRGDQAKTIKLHRIVALTWKSNINELREVNHLDDNMYNNTAYNLEWCDRHINQRQANAKRNMQGSGSRSVWQYDMEGNVIREWSSIITASKELSIHDGSIVCVCKGKRSHAGGFVWKYRDVEITSEESSPIPGFEAYRITKQGDVIGQNGKTLKPFLAGAYYAVNLKKNGKSYKSRIHRLVAQTFIANPENKPYVDHINGNPLDNRTENLRWADQKENMANPNTKQKMGVQVGKYTTDDELIATYDSMKAAADAEGLHKTTISLRVKNGTVIDGYQWKLVA